MSKQWLAGVFCVALSGCYESSADLIGQNESAIISADGPILLDNSVYYFDGRKICTVEIKAGVLQPCNGGYAIKLERTLLGNYIVQVSSNGSYRFGNWFRSDTHKLAHCFTWLGRDEYLGAATGQSGPKEIFGTREEMLSVVIQYEAKQGDQCDKYLNVLDSAVKIEGDRRDAPAFDFKPAVQPKLPAQ